MTKLNILFVTFLVFCNILNLSLTIEWSSKNNLKKAFKVNYYGKNHYFCQASDPNTGLNYTGRFKEGESVCNIIKDKELYPTKYYEILTESDGEKLSLEYALPNRNPPLNALKCSDNDIPLNSCYLGIAMYGDGICDDGIGKINAKKGMIYTVSVFEEFSRCPFFMYIGSVKV